MGLQSAISRSRKKTGVSPESGRPHRAIPSPSAALASVLILFRQQRPAEVRQAAAGQRQPRRGFDEEAKHTKDVL